MDSLDSLDDVNTLFKNIGASQKDAKKVLDGTHFADKLNDTVEGAAEGAEAMSNLAKATDGLKDGANAVDDLGNAFKGLGVQIGSAFKALAMNPMTYLVGAAIGTGFLINNYIKAFDKAKEKSLQAQGEYSSTASEIQSINSQLETSNARIAEIQSKGTITLTEQAELDRLQLQNAELERQLGLKESLASEQSKEARDNAMEALGYKRTEDMTQEVVGGADKLGNAVMTYGQTDLLTATSNELKALKKLKEKRNKLLKDRKSSKNKPEIDSELKSLENDIAKFEDSVTSNMQNVSDLRNSFIDTSTGEMLKGLSSKEIKYYDEMTRLINDFNNIDLNPTEKALKNLDSFFSSSSGRNAIKEQLQDAVNSGRDLSTELSRMGLTLDDLGIDNISQLSSYLQDASESAQDAKKSIQDYSASASDVKVAGESADQDSDWSTIQGAYKTAKELLKEGKTGTDDFQSVASFLNPTVVKDEIEKAKKNGGYIADAYQKAFEKSKKYADRWFGEDEANSMKNFVNDFKKEGLFDVSTDSKGLWDIDAKFKTTAEAANEFGMSVQSIETMLHGLEAYGYDFGDLIFSTDGLSRYETALNGLKQIQKGLSDSSAKDRLGGLIEGWDAEYSKISDDLSTLTEPQIIKIEFEYSLAQIQQEIYKLQNLANEGGDSQTWAELNANKRAYRDKSESREGNKLATDVEEYKQTSETIIALQDQMKNATTDAQKVAIQEQISGLYELQNAMNDAFADSGLSWDEFKNSSQGTFDELLASSEEAKKAVADLLGIDVDDIKIDVDADTSKAEEKLSGVLSYSDETIIMNIDASTSEIQTVIDNLKNGQNVVFSANVEVDGEQVNQAIAAVKNQDGTISYVANIDGVQYYLDKIDNPDGTVNYKLGEVPKEVPPAKQVVFREPDNSGVSSDPNPVGQGVKRYIINPSGIFSNLKSITQNVVKTISTKFGGGADLFGTAYNSGTFDNSFIRNEWKTSKGEVALTGEKAPEIVANGNRWWTVGENGAEFSYIPPNSVVFNAEQSKQLLEKGYINSRGTAHLSGTAYRLGSGTSSTANSKKKPSNKTSKKPSTKAKAKSSSSSSSKSSAEKAAEDLIDWIAVLLERVATIQTIQ